MLQRMSASIFMAPHILPNLNFQFKLGRMWGAMKIEADILCNILRLTGTKCIITCKVSI